MQPSNETIVTKIVIKGEMSFALSIVGAVTGGRAMFFVSPGARVSFVFRPSFCFR